MKSKGNSVVVRTGSALRTEVVANGHTLVADEPVGMGGTNSGPTPYDYLLAALGACTAMTVRMYADLKKWSLESVAVRLVYQKAYRDDREVRHTNVRNTDRIGLELELSGALEVQQRRRLLEIAERCPVHQTLGSKVLVETRLTTSLLDSPRRRRSSPRKVRAS